MPYARIYHTARLGRKAEAATLMEVSAETVQAVQAKQGHELYSLKRFMCTLVEDSIHHTRLVGPASGLEGRPRPWQQRMELMVDQRCARQRLPGRGILTVGTSGQKETPHSGKSVKPK